MKSYFAKHHQIIDKISVAVFLYSISVLALLLPTACIQGTLLRTITVLLLPGLWVNGKLISKVNQKIHHVFNFHQ